MINADRIVSVTSIDLISLYGLILKIGDTDFAASGGKLDATNPAEFDVTADGIYLAAEPVKMLDFASTASASTVYFVPAYNYAGFKIAGESVEAAGDEVTADGKTIYAAELASGAVTITKIGF